MIKLVKVISILTLAPALAPGAEGALPTATEAARMSWEEVAAVKVEL